MSNLLTVDVIPYNNRGDGGPAAGLLSLVEVPEKAIVPFMVNAFDLQLNPIELIWAQVKGFVAEHFRPEFVNRIDEIVVFNNLEKSQIKSIAASKIRSHYNHSIFKINCATLPIGQTTIIKYL
jgi:hypothetical protein